MSEQLCDRVRGGTSYRTQLTDQQIAAGEHRAAVGGDWEKIGRWQFEFMCEQGLRPHCRLLDVGCGALRGGIHFIAYLDPGNYHGLDLNESLIRAGREVELPHAGLVERRPHLLVDDAFDFGRFGTTFDYALATSVFTHLPANDIQRCLVRMAEVLEPGARFYATYFEAPTRQALEPVRRPSGNFSHSDRDPFHYHFSWFEFLTAELPLSVINVGECGHPRRHQLLEFVRS